MAEVMAVLAVVAWWCWTMEKDEAQQVRDGIDAEEWREKRAKVRKAMDGRPEWLRRWERKVLGIRRLGDRKLNSEAKR